MTGVQTCALPISFGEPGNDRTHFNRPTDMAITPDGEVFISDGYGNEIGRASCRERV